MTNEVFFDVETQKLFEDIEGNDPSDLKLSVVSVYSRTLDSNLNETNGKLESFWEEDIENLWPLFQNTDRIIGFNTKKFDVPVLQPYALIPLSKFNHFDIMEKIKEILGNRLPLNTIAKETLGKEKIADGFDAVALWEKHDTESLEKLRKYCEEDVLITKDIYDFVLENKYLKYMDRWNTPRTININFDYPTDDVIKQGGLF